MHVWLAVSTSQRKLAHGIAFAPSLSATQHAGGVEWNATGPPAPALWRYHDCCVRSLSTLATHSPKKSQLINFSSFHSPRKLSKLPIWDPQSDFPESPWVGLLVGIPKLIAEIN